MIMRSRLAACAIVGAMSVAGCGGSSESSDVTPAPAITTVAPDPGAAAESAASSPAVTAGVPATAAAPVTSVVSLTVAATSVAPSASEALAVSTVDPPINLPPPSDVAAGDDIAEVFAGDPASEFCDLLRAAEENAALDRMFQGGDPAEAERLLGELVDILGQMVVAAPGEIRGDVEIVSGQIDTLRDILAAYDYDLDNLAAAMESDPEVAAVFEAPAPGFEAAGQRLDEYTEQVCGVDA